MKTNNNSTPHPYRELSAEEWEEIWESAGVPAVGRSNEGWIHLLQQRLHRQKREFASLLDHAAENPDLFEHCESFRHKIEATRRRLADCRALRHQLN